jgi:hypothetical protein
MARRDDGVTVVTAVEAAQALSSDDDVGPLPSYHPKARLGAPMPDAGGARVTSAKAARRAARAARRADRREFARLRGLPPPVDSSSSESEEDEGDGSGPGESSSSPKGRMGRSPVVAPLHLCITCLALPYVVPAVPACIPIPCDPPPPPPASPLPPSPPRCAYSWACEARDVDDGPCMPEPSLLASAHARAHA